MCIVANMLEGTLQALAMSPVLELEQCEPVLAQLWQWTWLPVVPGSGEVAEGMNGVEELLRGRGWGSRTRGKRGGEGSLT